MGVLLLLIVIIAVLWGLARLEERRELMAAERVRFEAYLQQQERALTGIAPLDARQQSLLRRSLNAQHLEAARRLGTEPIARRADVSDRVRRDGLVQIGEHPHYWVSSLRHSFPYVTPDGAAALDLIGQRFEQRLAEAGLPAFRFNVTSVLRTAEDQTRLRRTNVNASSGASSHQFGTTFDIHYQRFRYGGDARAEVQRALGPLPVSSLYDEFAEELETFYQRMAGRYATRIGAELGRVLIQLENERQALTIRERLQPVYHVTVAARLAS